MIDPEQVTAVSAANAAAEVTPSGADSGLTKAQAAKIGTQLAADVIDAMRRPDRSADLWEEL